MTTLYIGSTEAFCGKSAVTVGIGLGAKDRGRAVGYMKPVSIGVGERRTAEADDDAAVMVQIFGMKEDLASVAPIALTHAELERVLGGQIQTEYQQVLLDAYQRLAAGKDLLVLEGGGTLCEGYTIGLPAQVVTRMLNAKALVVVPYGQRFITDDVLLAQNILGDALLGVVLNRVPRHHMRFAEEAVRPFLEKRGIRVYGVLPEERLLQAVSVREIAGRLGGEILNADEAADQLVENLMVGAMSVDSALSYFRRLPNKAVITGGDRPDVQLAALETSTRCIILTGNLHPSPIILSRAEELGVPMVLVKTDTLTTVEAISSFFGHTRFHQPKKIERIRELLTERFDTDGLFRDLGLS
jgi:uncharacterized protein